MRRGTINNVVPAKHPYIFLSSLETLRATLESEPGVKWSLNDPLVFARREVRARSHPGFRRGLDIADAYAVDAATGLAVHRYARPPAAAVDPDGFVNVSVMVRFRLS